MNCIKCGATLLEGQKFCPNCGAAVSEKQTPNNMIESEEFPLEFDDEKSALEMNTPVRVTVGEKAQTRFHCPNCGSERLHAITETNNEMEMETTGGGYSGGQACLGTILLGPLGLLCGNCGRSQKTSVTMKSETRNYWICQDCNRKFRNLEEWYQELMAEQERIDRILATQPSIELGKYIIPGRMIWITAIGYIAMMLFDIYIEGIRSWYELSRITIAYIVVMGIISIFQAITFRGERIQLKREIRNYEEIKRKCGL